MSNLRDRSDCRCRNFLQSASHRTRHQHRILGPKPTHHRVV